MLRAKKAGILPLGEIRLVILLIVFSVVRFCNNLTYNNFTSQWHQKPDRRNGDQSDDKHVHCWGLTLRAIEE
jgi:hypothetical protein